MRVTVSLAGVRARRTAARARTRIVFFSISTHRHSTFEPSGEERIPQEDLRSPWFKRTVVCLAPGGAAREPSRPPPPPPPPLLPLGLDHRLMGIPEPHRRLVSNAVCRSVARVCVAATLQERKYGKVLQAVPSFFKIPVWWRRAVLPSLPWNSCFLSFLPSFLPPPPGRASSALGTLTFSGRVVRKHVRPSPGDKEVLSGDDF